MRPDPAPRPIYTRLSPLTGRWATENDDTVAGKPGVSHNSSVGRSLYGKSRFKGAVRPLGGERMISKQSQQQAALCDGFVFFKEQPGYNIARNFCLIVCLFYVAIAAGIIFYPEKFQILFEYTGIFKIALMQYGSEYEKNVHMLSLENSVSLSLLSKIIFIFCIAIYTSNESWRKSAVCALMRAPLLWLISLLYVFVMLINGHRLHLYLLDSRFGFREITKNLIEYDAFFIYVIVMQIILYILLYNAFIFLYPSAAAAWVLGKRRSS